MIQPNAHLPQAPRRQIGYSRLEHDPDGKYIVVDLAEPARDEVTVEDLYGMLSAAHTYLEEHKGLSPKKPLSHFIRPEVLDQGGFITHPECVEVSYRDAGGALQALRVYRLCDYCPVVSIDLAPLDATPGEVELC